MIKEEPVSMSPEKSVDIQRAYGAEEGDLLASKRLIRQSRYAKYGPYTIYFFTLSIPIFLQL
jgi:hypothetical protein